MPPTHSSRQNKERNIAGETTIVGAAASSSLENELDLFASCSV